MSDVRRQHVGSLNYGLLRPRHAQAGRKHHRRRLLLVCLLGAAINSALLLFPARVSALLRLRTGSYQGHVLFPTHNLNGLCPACSTCSAGNSSCQWNPPTSAVTPPALSGSVLG